MSTFNFEPEQVDYYNAGGVGFDINCGVRLLRTNLFEKDIQPIKEQLAQVKEGGVVGLKEGLEGGIAMEGVPN